MNRRSEPVVPLSLKPDLAWCEAVIREHSGSFYRAFSRLPAARAQAVFAVYAFCRQVDDSIDVDHDVTAFEQLAGQLQAFAEGQTPDEPLWRSLRWAFSAFPLEIGPFREMIEGQRLDMDFHQPETKEELLRYCYLVAGTVGLMILPLLTEKPTARLRETAIELGLAMQLTNILRDIGADYRLGRIYLPADELAKRGISQEDLGRARPTPALRKLWLDLAQETLGRYQAVRRALALFDAKARLPVILSILYYSHITLLGIKNPDKVLARRIIVPDSVKLLLLGKAHYLLWRTGRRKEV